MKKTDSLKILGFEATDDPSPEQIKKAYKKAALKWHPDRHSNKSEEEQLKAEVIFKDLNPAMEQLLNPKENDDALAFNPAEAGYPWALYKTNSYRIE